MAVYSLLFINFMYFEMNASLMFYTDIIHNIQRVCILFIIQGVDAKSSPAKKTKNVEKADENKAAASESLDDLDFSSEASTKSGNSWNTKFISMNVNGFRAWIKVCFIFTTS